MRTRRPEPRESKTYIGLHPSASKLHFHPIKRHESLSSLSQPLVTPTMSLIINGVGSASHWWLEAGTLCSNQYKPYALRAHPPEPGTRTINLLVGARYETPTHLYQGKNRGDGHTRGYTRPDQWSSSKGQKLQCQIYGTMIVFSSRWLKRGPKLIRIKTIQRFKFGQVIRVFKASDPKF
jgi:hypothetical protein